VFGFSFSELLVVIVVALVVMGPKDLPKMLRKLGQWAGKLRRMAADLRAQSGIDDALRSEGLAEDIAEIRKLARGELDVVRREATVDLSGAAAATAATAASSSPRDPYYHDDFYVVREREYPRDCADAYGALTDNAIVYDEGLPKSPLARDPLYVAGDENAELPPEAEPPPPSSRPSDATPVAAEGLR
jgi:sec-independent protein translocase protein TatB